MDDVEIAQRVRRLNDARWAERNKTPIADDEAARVWHDLWTEYWGPGDGIDWILGRNES